MIAANSRKPSPASIDRGGALRCVWLRAPPRSIDPKTHSPANRGLTPMAPYEGGKPPWNDAFNNAHGSSRIGRPASAMCSLACRTVYSPKWKIEAASTAVAWPSRMPSTRWSRLPTPPEAMTGTRDGVGDGAGQRDVVAGLGAVAVHRGEQDLAGAERHDLAWHIRPRRCRSGCARHG